MMLHDIRLSARTLREISEYIEPHEGSADVLLLRCGEDVLVGQGDDRCVFDPKGERRDDDGTLGTYDQVKAEQRAKIMTAVNAGADMVCEAMAAAGYLRSDSSYDVSSLIVNAIGTVLDDPNVDDMTDVLLSNWDAHGIAQWREELGDGIDDAALKRANA
jgi:hypothetical protein